MHIMAICHRSCGRLGKKHTIVSLGLLDDAGAHVAFSWIFGPYFVVGAIFQRKGSH